MVEQLFGSKTRVKMLKHFFQHPDEQFYVRELTRAVEEQINSVRRELMNLASAGIIESHNKDNKVYYTVNKNYESFEGLRMVFTSGGVRQSEDDVAAAGTSLQQDIPTTEDTPAHDTKSFQDFHPASKKSPIKRSKIKVKDANLQLVAKKLKNIPGVDLVYISGQLLRTAGVMDMLVVGGDRTSVVDTILGIEEYLGQTLHYVHLDREDFSYRRKINDRSLATLFQSRHELIVNNDPELTESK